MKKSDFIEYYKSTSFPMGALMRLAPKDQLDWKPKEDAWSLGQLLDHCSESPYPVLATLNEKWPTPEELQKRMANSKNRPQKDGDTAAKDFESLVNTVLQSLDSMPPQDFEDKETTVPVVNTGRMSKVIQFWVDHQNNHKVELFMYLKLLGVPVNTMTLVRGTTPEQK